MLTLGELERVINSGSLDCAIQEFHFKTDSQNQLLFFVKPEVFLLPRSADSVSVCALMLQKMSQFGADTAGAYMISGAALERYGIMDTHYGFINRMSREASVLLDDEERHRIYKQFPGEGPPILGGHEVLAHRPELTASALDQIWSTKKSIKLRSGLYVQEFEIRGEQLIVVNGFHPLQLEHFTGTGRRVLLILMISPTPSAGALLSSKPTAEAVRLEFASHKGDTSSSVGPISFPDGSSETGRKLWMMWAGELFLVLDT